MKKIALAFFALTFLCAGTKYSLPDDLGKWTTFYYLEPHPEQVPAALEAIAAKGYFENDDVQAPLSGFFTEIFRANPEKLDEWVRPFIGMPNRHILYSSLWMANSKQSKAALERLAKGAKPEESKRLRHLLSSPPPTIESMDVDSPAALDYMWGAFMASGAEEPVLRVIDQMKLINTKGDVGKILVGGAAKWSVSANARQHDKVMKIVKARVATADAETKVILEEIINSAKAGAPKT